MNLNELHTALDKKTKEDAKEKYQDYKRAGGKRSWSEFLPLVAQLINKTRQPIKTGRQVAEFEKGGPTPKRFPKRLP